MSEPAAGWFDSGAPGARRSLAAMTEAVRAGHPFETPAILFLPTSGGDGNYVGWILEETAGAK